MALRRKIRLCRRRPAAEPWPERPAAKRQEREKWRSTSVETTGHLSVRARRQWSILGLGSMFASPTKWGRREPAEPTRGGGFGSPPVAPELERS